MLEMGQVLVLELISPGVGMAIVLKFVFTHLRFFGFKCDLIEFDLILLLLQKTQVPNSVYIQVWAQILWSMFFIFAHITDLNLGQSLEHKQTFTTIHY